MGTVKTRDYKINWMTTHIELADREGISINKEKFMNLFCFDCKSTIRTAEEILDIIIKTDKVFEIEGNLLGPRLHNEIYNKSHIKPLQEDSKEVDEILSAVEF